MNDVPDIPYEGEDEIDGWETTLYTHFYEGELTEEELLRIENGEQVY